MSESVRIFLAGIIQGSLARSTHNQDYRDEVKRLLKERLPTAIIDDPVAEHPDSINYDFDTGRDTFFDLMDRAAHADVLVAFFPEASMGTAVELWTAFHAGTVIVCVTPLAENWVPKFLADAIVPDLNALEEFLAAGKLEAIMNEKIGYE